MSDISFIRYVLERGGRIKPLLLPPEETNGTGLCNPSVIVHEGMIMLNLRHVQYTMFHSELHKYEHVFGPLVYLNPSNDPTLTTVNYHCILNSELEIVRHNRVDTSEFDKTPLWEFVGLEDGKLAMWNNNLLMFGVRRDIDTIGTGRMECTALQVNENSVKEVSRTRIPAPPPDDTYCEKNWMPISDIPYHFVKWTNPTEIVKWNPIDNTCETVYNSGEYIHNPNVHYDLRGGSQVIPYKDIGYVGCVHEVEAYQSEAGRKDGTYRHRFVLWNKDFSQRRYSKRITFADTKVEFCTGLVKYNDTYLITFGVQDNVAFIMQIPDKVFEEFVEDVI